MSQVSTQNEEATKIKEENKMLKDKLERANQQIKLLAAVLQIVHEDLSMKNEQLEILYSNLRQNPVWQDCMNTVNQVNDDNNDDRIQNLNDDDKKKLSRLIKRSKDDTSTSMILITRQRGSSRSAVRSRSLSPSGRINRDCTDYNDNIIEDYRNSNQNHHHNRHKLVLSNDIWPMDEFTYSSESSCDEYGRPKKDMINPYDPEVAFSKFHKSLHKRKRDKKRDRKRKHKREQRRLERAALQFNRRDNNNNNNNDNHLNINYDEMDPSLSPSPMPSPLESPNKQNVTSYSSKTWKEQFMDRIHIEKNWRQGKSKVMTLIGHNGSVTDLKFDEYRLITSSDDGSIILWHLNNMKKWKPKSKNKQKYNERIRKQLEKGSDSDSTNNPTPRYKFFPTKEEKKNDDDDEELDLTENKYDNNNEDQDKEKEREFFPRAPIGKKMKPALLSPDEDNYSDDSVSSSMSTSQSIMNVAVSAAAKANPNSKLNTNLQLNNLYHLNDDWSINDTKLSAWRHSFVTSFGQSFKNRLTFASSKKKQATKTWGKQLDTQSMLLQNHHYSKDLNFKRLSFQGHGGPIWALDFDHELLVSGSYDKCIKIWNILNGNCRATLRGHEEWVSGVRLRHKYVLSCSWDASIRLWKLDETRWSGKCISKLQSQSGNAIYCIQWSIDKNFIVSGCRHQAVQIWDLQKEKMIKTFMGHTKQVYCLQMSNNLILSGSADRSIKMWDPRSAACLGTFNDHMGPVMKLQFDDHKLISAGYDKQVRIFDLRARKQLHSLSGHSKFVFCLQYDHKKIITGSADKRVLVWNFE